MRFTSVIYSGIVNFIYLFRSYHSLKVKFKILALWFKIMFKYFTISRIRTIKKENIFGFEINAFDYHNILFLFTEIFYKNEYYFKTDNKSPIIFDCGSNIGFATIFFKWLYPESTIYAFEPDKNTFELLKYNVDKNNLKNIYLYNCAITDKIGYIDFYVDSEAPGSLIMSAKKERISADKVTVESITLTSVIEKHGIEAIDFMKMDIEGSEFEAINDLANNNHINIINRFVIEYHHKMSTQKSNLGSFLNVFETNGYEYQIDTKNIPICADNRYQDILLSLYK